MLVCKNKSDSNMGFYIRKGFNFGPLRLNLSRSGLGASVGVKGARIGIGPRGSYIQMGRGGLYYRQTLSPTSRTPYSPLPAQPQVGDELKKITSTAAVAMADSSATDLLNELNRVKKRTEMFPIVGVLDLIVICGLGMSGAPWSVVALAFVAATILAVYARNTDVLKGTAILNYALEGDAAQNFERLQEPFRQLATCECVWHINAAGRNADTKRHAGATTNLDRTEMRPRFSCPPRVQCNLKLPTLTAGNTTLYFFPDRLLVYDSGGVGAIAYAELEVQAQASSFVEHGKMPRDSRQVGSTWQYVNKKGGPDRRFSNNRQLPVMQYGVFGFSSKSGLSALFMCSRSDIASLFSQFINQQPPSTNQGQLVKV